jgi:hypothetical protein
MVPQPAFEPDDLTIAVDLLTKGFGTVQGLASERQKLAPTAIRYVVFLDDPSPQVGARCP